jgi:hypothetical protein
MAIAMSKEFSDNAWRDSIMLWNAWIWEELLSKNTQAALQLVLSIVDGKPHIEPAISPDNVSQPLLLKTRRVSVSIPRLKVTDSAML